MSKTDSGPTDQAWLDGARYVTGQRAGHYESYYQRANHPDRPLAFWIRTPSSAPKAGPRRRSVNCGPCFSTARPANMP